MLSAGERLTEALRCLQVPAKDPQCWPVQADSSCDQPSLQEQAASLGKSIFQVLLQWRLQSQEDDMWDACFAVIAQSLIAHAHQSEKPLGQILGGMPVLHCFLAQPEAAGLLMRSLLASPEGQGKSGWSFALDLYAAMFHDSTTGLLAGSSELLKPESNCPMVGRHKALKVMIRAANKRLDHLEASGSGDAAMMRMWPEEALRLVLYTATHDPALRMRRAAMHLLTTAVVPTGSQIEFELLAVLLLKCRDRDAATAKVAFDMLAQMPKATLHRAMHAGDWASVISHAFGRQPIAGALPRDPEQMQADRQMDEDEIDEKERCVKMPVEGAVL
ncbi:hypothetical protein WJX73_005053 [Symbiochloris irregularis]|uniref:Uncharacterized protein n=1 Tax=Symbiochloris irregularis TaxID=706552 RepID=A0AAW1P396_9CHLO